MKKLQRTMSDVRCAMGEQELSRNYRGTIEGSKAILSQNKTKKMRSVKTYLPEGKMMLIGHVVSSGGGYYNEDNEDEEDDVGQDDLTRTTEAVTC